ncbi:MAG: hypothetical protein NVSMB18_05480 [Acetobacteraceae bacterium]
MSRTPIATLAGLTFVAAYVIVAVWVPETLPRLHWSLQALYWAAAGLLWIVPVRWLMLWAAGKR